MIFEKFDYLSDVIIQFYIHLTVKQTYDCADSHVSTNGADAFKF